MDDEFTEHIEILYTRHRASGTLISERWLRNGASHRVDGPASTDYDPITGNTVRQVWSQDGKPHREDGPAVQAWDPRTGKLVEEQYRRHGAYHRMGDHPAKWRKSAETGVMIEESYMVNGGDHRLEGPSRLLRDEKSGKVISESWARDGEPHRDRDLAAFVSIDPRSGVVYEEAYWSNGELTRENGPVLIERDRETGAIVNETYPETDIEGFAPEHLDEEPKP